MKPLDLTTAPPRAPRESLAGIVFLPRTIDKVRATLPGGDSGAYNIPGFSEMMLEALGIELDAFRAAVADANDDDGVAAFVTAATSSDRIGRWNALILARLPRNGDRSAALEAYPWLHKRPDLVLALDVLEEDDRQHFARPT
jgi:predicted trehalose synthase